MEEPTDSCKESLQKRISKIGTQEHLYIYNKIKELPNKIYTLGKGDIIFDLNNLPINMFWDINEYVIQSLECIERNKIINKYKDEYDNTLNNIFK